MAITLPMVRTYYAASAAEPERLLCWIPPGDLAAMIQHGQAAACLLEDYPVGMEIEVSERALENARLILPAHPASLQGAYSDLRAQGRVPVSGRVQGAYLEQMATQHGSQLLVAAVDMVDEQIGHLPLGPAPEPTMSPGEEPVAAMRRLANRE
jgi:hypothetical protein